MIRFRLNELLAERSFKEGRRIEWREVAESAGLHRTTLSRMLNVRGYNASATNLDSLCKYFGCQVGDLATYVPDAELEVPVIKSYRGPRPAAGRPPDHKPASKRQRTAGAKTDKR